MVDHFHTKLVVVFTEKTSEQVGKGRAMRMKQLIEAEYYRSRKESKAYAVTDQRSLYGMP